MPRSELLSETFTGHTLEEAMAGAVATLGPGLSVLSAHKVRAGVRGLVGKPRYEVAARAGARPGAPAPASALSPLAAMPSATRPPRPHTPAGSTAGSAAGSAADVDAVDLALQGLLAQADAADEVSSGRGRRRTRTRAEQLPTGPGIVPGFASLPWDDIDAEVVLVPTAREGSAVSRSPSATADVATRQVPGRQANGPEPVRWEPRRAVAGPPSGSGPWDSEPASESESESGSESGSGSESESESESEVGAGTEQPAGSVTPAATRPQTARTPAGWSRVALASLGLPAVILAALPAEDPQDDLGWLVALTNALGQHLPAPVAPSAEHPVVLSGHGLPGALALIDAAVHGGALGVIDHGDGPVSATAVELALEVRQHLRADG